MELKYEIGKGLKLALLGADPFRSIQASIKSEHVNLVMLVFISSLTPFSSFALHKRRILCIAKCKIGELEDLQS